MPTQPKRRGGDKLARYLYPPSARERVARGMTTEPVPGRCYGYARVSTGQQVKEGESLDVQERTLTGYAMQHGFTIERTFVESGVSASIPLRDRPEGRALVAALRPGDVVLCLDRMFRSALDAEQMLQWFKKSSVTLHLIDLGGDVTNNGNNMVSTLVFRILSAVAQAERERTSERIAEVKRDQQRRGRFLGGDAPFGLAIEGKGREAKLVPIEEQQRAIKRVGQLHRQRFAAYFLAIRSWSEEAAHGRPIRSSSIASDSRLNSRPDLP
jgi:DNA invertase Pin-like site-specific DNA recombinase